jgi:four helix bundle protein
LGFEFWVFGFWFLVLGSWFGSLVLLARLVLVQGSMATVNRFEDLVAWQLANDLKVRVYALIAKPRVGRDVNFCDQIRESSRSAPRNIAEGFTRYRPREFARFLTIALGSLGETQNHLRDALEQEYIDKIEFNDLMLLSSRAIGASVRLYQYLINCPDRAPTHDKRREEQHTETTSQTQTQKPKTKNLKPKT